MLVKNTAYISLLLSVSSTLAHPGLPRVVGRNGVDIDVRGLSARSSLFKREESPDGSCGGAKKYSCGKTVEKCCSQYGWCGDTDLHCQPSENCQPAFGVCNNGTGGGEGQGGRCGKQGGNKVCIKGQCCSEGGYCGNTADHCLAPLCQVGFGKCDADTTPTGGSTDKIARPKIGSVPYDDGIYDCVNPGEVALTFDDGPDIYTDGMINLLKSYNAKATFFITGINNGKGAIDTTPAWNTVIKKMHADGHQLASHTWSHADLSTLTEARRREEMYKLEMAMRNIVGFIPTYMRPPYSSCNAACVKTMQALGYHIAYFDLDTDDYNNVTPELIINAKNNFYKAINPSNPTKDAFLAIAHDIHQQTAQNLTVYMLDVLKAKGYKAVTMGQCMGDPVANWYRSASRNSSSLPVGNSTSSSIDSTASPTPTSAPKLPAGKCAFKLENFCATEIENYATTSGCLAAVEKCSSQAEECTETVSASASKGCDKVKAVCKKQEANCAKCVEGGKCAYLKPVWT